MSKKTIIFHIGDIVTLAMVLPLFPIILIVGLTTGAKPKDIAAFRLSIWIRDMGGTIAGYIDGYFGRSRDE